MLRLSAVKYYYYRHEEKIGTNANCFIRRAVFSVISAAFSFSLNSHIRLSVSFDLHDWHVHIDAVSKILFFSFHCRRRCHCWRRTVSFTRKHIWNLSAYIYLQIIFCFDVCLMHICIAITRPSNWHNPHCDVALEIEYFGRSELLIWEALAWSEGLNKARRRLIFYFRPAEYSIVRGCFFRCDYAALVCLEWTVIKSEALIFTNRRLWVHVDIISGLWFMPDSYINI